MVNIPISISYLPNLQHLDMSQTSLRVIIQRDLVSNPQLTKIDFGSMPDLESVGNCSFCNFPKLTQVTFAKSKKLSEIHPNAFGYHSLEIHPKIEHLDIEDCNIGTLHQNLLDWDLVENLYIDLNHFTCDCKISWLIDDLKKNNSRFQAKMYHSYLGKLKLHSSDIFGEMYLKPFFGEMF